MDRAAILSNILRRNALRREAKLPALPVRETFEREVLIAEWSEIYRRHYQETRQQVLQNLRAKHGPDFGNSAGGRWAVELLTKKTLRERYWRKP